MHKTEIFRNSNKSDRIFLPTVKKIILIKKLEYVFYKTFYNVDEI